MNAILQPTGRETAAALDYPAARAPGAVSWGAVFAGAAGAAALSLILLILGVGLGLSSVSPWAEQGMSAASFGFSTIAWLTFTQLAASGMGGYLAGRLRMRWSGVHADEVYFRDSAHGFLAWAVASLVTASMLASAVGGIVGTGAAAATTAAAGTALAVGEGAAFAGAGRNPAEAAVRTSDARQTQAYFSDSLFRKMPSDGVPATAATPTPPSASTAPPSAPAPVSAPAAGTVSGGDAARMPVEEAGRIFASGARNGSLPTDDARYLGQLVAQHTGLSPAEAEKRVSDTFARMQAQAKEAEASARDAADKARKASAKAALWMFVSLLIGAFIAALAGTWGGRHRDLV